MFTFLNGMEEEILNLSSSLDNLNWDYQVDEFNTPGLPTPAPRPSLARRQTPGSSASFHPHTRSRGPAIGYEVQTPPDIRIARWKRIDRKVSREARRSALFGRNRANSDTSLLYNLGTGEENLSFGDIRFEDSYNLAEPEPVLEPVILNFRPVPVEIEPEMAGQGENVDAILQADEVPQQPLALPVVPVPAAQNIDGGGNQAEAPPPPRVPPNIKLDPNIPGLNLNTTIQQWVVLQDAYNAHCTARAGTRRGGRHSTE